MCQNVENSQRVMHSWSGLAKANLSPKILYPGISMVCVFQIQKLTPLVLSMCVLKELAILAVTLCIYKTKEGLEIEFFSMQVMPTVKGLFPEKLLQWVRLQTSNPQAYISFSRTHQNQGCRNCFQVVGLAWKG